MPKRFFRRRKKRGVATLFILAAGMIVLLSFHNQGSLNYEGGTLPVDEDELRGRIVSFLMYPILILLVLIGIYSAFKLYRKKQWRKKLRMSHIDELDQMTGKEFEEYLQVYFGDLGYRVEPKGGSGDRGGDLILTATDGKRIVVQAKRYSKHVPFEAIQQAHTARSLYKCHEAWVVTNNKGFTKQARETADDLNVHLWDRKKLIERMAVYNETKAKGSVMLQEMAHTPFGPVYSLPNSSVFHTTECKNGRYVSQKQNVIRYNDASEAVRAGKRKCNCYE